MRCFLVLVCFVVACDRATAPPPFTLGPGCWTKVYVDDNSTTHLLVHYDTCPAAFPPGQQFRNWDTTWVR